MAILETSRLIIRELIPNDAAGILKLDSDPDVHRYLGMKLIDNLEEANANIEFIRKQYQKNGVGRWAVITKESNTFVGWAGLKLIDEPVNNRIGYYDLGYRLIKEYWGKGYAKEAAIAVVEYGFKRLALKEIYGMAHVENQASIKIMEGIGFNLLFSFDYQELPHYFFKKGNYTHP